MSRASDLGYECQFFCPLRRFHHGFEESDTQLALFQLENARAFMPFWLYNDAINLGLRSRFLLQVEGDRALMQPLLDVGTNETNRIASKPPSPHSMSELNSKYLSGE